MSKFSQNGLRAALGRLALGIVVTGCALTLPAQVVYKSRPSGTTVKVQGASTAHAWEMEGTRIGGHLDLPGVLDAAQPTIAGMKGDKLPATLHVIIPVASLNSKADHLPEVMDRLMQKQLNAEQFPLIEYELGEMVLKGPHAANQPFQFDTKGKLSIAGKTKEVSFPVTVEQVDAKLIKIKGSVPLKMTDFGVEPPAPVIGGGLLKCADDITIVIDWSLAKKD